MILFQLKQRPLDIFSYFQNAPGGIQLLHFFSLERTPQTARWKLNEGTGFNCTRRKLDQTESNSLIIRY